MDLRHLAGWLVVCTEACTSSPHAPDAGPPGLTGLGQSCVPSMSGADCPASAPGCLEFTTPGVGFCSQQCVTDGALTTDGGAGISSITPDPLADAQLGICTAIYSGAIGQAACGAIYQYSPMDAQLQPSSTYSGVSIACSIVCDESQRCPGTLQCNTILDRCEP